MHLGRFHFVISTLRRNHEFNKIDVRFKSLIGALNGVVGNPSNQDFAKQFRDQLNEIRLALGVNHPDLIRPIALSIVDSISARGYYGEALYERIRSAVFNSQFAPALAVNSLNEVFKDVQEFYKNIAAIEGAFDALHVEYDALDEGEGELGLLVPKIEDKSTLKDFSTELKDWHRALWPMAEVFDPGAPELSIKTVATTDWMIYLAATPLVLAGIARSMKDINTILAEAIKMKESIRSLIGGGFSKEAIDALEVERKNKVEQRLDALSDKIVEENFKGEQGRKSELKNAMSVSIKIITGKIIAGAKVELHYIPPPKKNQDNPDVDEQGVAGNDEIVAKEEELRAISAELDEAVPALDFNASRQDAEALMLELQAHSDQKDTDPTADQLP